MGLLGNLITCMVHSNSYNIDILIATEEHRPFLQSSLISIIIDELLAIY